MSTRSTDTLTKTSDYKKMLTNSSLDSLEKSVYTSSVEDYDPFGASEDTASNMRPYGEVPPSKQFTFATPYDQHLAYKNEGFRDNSTFTSNSNYQSRADSVQENVTPTQEPTELSYPPSEYYNTDTLPLSYNKSPSTFVDSNSDVYTNGSSAFMKDLEKMLASGRNEIKTRPASAVATSAQPEEQKRKPVNYSRAKSETMLETNFDDDDISQHSINLDSRSKSQPLETAM